MDIRSRAAIADHMRQQLSRANSGLPPETLNELADCVADELYRNNVELQEQVEKMEVKMAALSDNVQALTATGLSSSSS